MVAVGGRVRVQYAATDLGDHLVGELHDVEGVGGDLAVRQGRADPAAVGCLSRSPRPGPPSILSASLRTLDYRNYRT